MGRFVETRKPIWRRVAAVAAMSGLVLSYFVAMSPANAQITSPSPIDTSNAVRYNPDGSVIGNIIFDFVSNDDAFSTIDAPFPINFFGTKLPSLCITTNGVVFPAVDTSVTCAFRSSGYDRGLESLALRNQSSAIAPLALDLNNASGKLRNPQRETTEELFFTGVSWVNDASTSALTFSTSEPHGFRVGELVSVNATIGGTYVSTGRVTAVGSATTFTLLVGQRLNDNDGNSVPTNASPVLSRDVIYERVTRMDLSGSTLTIRVDGLSDFGVGGKLTLTGTGIPGLDDARLSVLSRVDATNFTVTVPPSLVDLDPDTAGIQTTREFTNSSTRPWALERDETGAINQIYFGTTTVNGQDAYALTWYRYSNNDDAGSEPRTISTTIQLVIIKQPTGSDSEGWDFGFEYNIGHSNDPSDGYLSTNPNTNCQPNNLPLCRWGMGTAGYFPGSQIAFYSVPDASKLDELVVETSTPHGLTSGQLVRVGDGLADLYQYQLSYDYVGARPVSQILDANRFILKTPPGDRFSAVIARTAGPADTRIGYSKSYELFASSPTPELIDSAGATSLVRNSLNSTVLGRYTFGMSGGNVTGFSVPTMGNGISGVVPGGPSRGAQPVMTVLDVNPTNITVEGEIITISGANLNTVTDVFIGGVRVQIFSQSGNRLQIRAPRGLSGVVDLELKSYLNDVLMTKKLNFGGTAAVGTKKATLVVGGFAPNSRKLTARMQARIDRWLDRNSDLGTLTCTGFTSLPRRTTDVTLSTNRGKTACNFSKRQRSGLETSVSQGIEDPRPGSNIRRVRLVLTP